MSLNFHFVFIVKNILQCIPVCWFTTTYRFNYYLMPETSSEILKNISMLLLFINVSMGKNRSISLWLKNLIKLILHFITISIEYIYIHSVTIF